MKFDQVWFWRDLDNTGDAFYGLTQDDEFDKEENHISMIMWNYHTNGDYGFARSEWNSRYNGNGLPKDEEEFWRMEFENNTNGWSVQGSRTFVLSDLNDNDQDIFRAFEDLYENADFVDEAEWGELTNVTEAIYGKETEMDIFEKIAELNSEIVDYINEVDEQIKEIKNERYEILNGRHVNLLNFLEQRNNLVADMFPGKRIEIETGFENVSVIFNGKIWVRFADWGMRIKLVAGHFCTTEHESETTVERYNKLISDWDAIQEDIFDRNLCGTLSEMMKEQVSKAKERLQEARNELDKIK